MEAFAGGQREFTLVRRVDLPGRSFWFRVQLSYWYSDAGEPCGYVILLQDVTTEHEAELRRKDMESSPPSRRGEYPCDSDRSGF